MKLSELDDCTQCPFLPDLCCGGMTSSPSGEPIEPPCTYWEDDDDLDDKYIECIHNIKHYEECEDKRIKAENEQKKRNEIKRNKAYESRCLVRNEQREITSIKRKIRTNNSILRLANSMASAINLTNEMFKYPERKIVRKNNPLEIENKKLQKRIDKLEAIKTIKLKQLKLKRKSLL